MAGCLSSRLMIFLSLNYDWALVLLLVHYWTIFFHFIGYSIVVCLFVFWSHAIFNVIIKAFFVWQNFVDRYCLNFVLSHKAKIVRFK